MTRLAVTWIALAPLLLVACARDNPLFGMGANGAGNGTGGGSSGGSMLDTGSPDTGTTAVGGDQGSESGKADTQGLGDTSTSSGGTTEGPPIDTDGSGCQGADIELLPLTTDGDIFVDSRSMCRGGPCAELHFGATQSREVGGVGANRSIYVAHFEGGLANVSVLSAVLHLPVENNKVTPTDAGVLVVPSTFVEQNIDGEVAMGASSYCHRQFDSAPWVNSDEPMMLGTFGIFAGWAEGVGLAQAQAIDETDVEGDPRVLEIELNGTLLDRVATDLATVDGIVLAFTTDDEDANWRIRAREDGEPAVLQLEVCDAM